MKITMIVGEPCVGKSLLVRELIRLDGPWVYFSPKFVPFHANADGHVILGRYDEPHQFPGTDRMSMAAQPRVLDWLAVARTRGVKSVTFEGDRLGNISMLRHLKAMQFDLQVIHLWLRDEYLNKRRAAERNQSLTFLRSRRSKVNRLVFAAREFGLPLISCENVNLADTYNIIAHIRTERR
jgi:hypothetical protein